MNPIKVFIETGKKKIFTGAIEWPGWCRSSRDEKTALQALVDYGPRYSRGLHRAGVVCQVPTDVAGLILTERHEGNATTDFGAPAVMLDADRAAMDPMELERLQTILKAGWQTFDNAVQQAKNHELRKGPRGGGRELGQILDHLIEADQAYLSRLAWKYERTGDKNPAVELHRTREAILNALAAAANGELPAQGPRGGTLWPARYFIRRVAWHVLDHAWEIEDRIV